MLRNVSIVTTLSLVLLSSSAWPVLANHTLLSEYLKDELQRPNSPIRIVKLNGEEQVAADHLGITGTAKLHKKNIDGKGTKIIAIEGIFDPTRSAYANNLSESTLENANASEGIVYYYFVSPYLLKNYGDHASNVAGIITSVAPRTTLRVIDYAKEAYVANAQGGADADRTFVKALQIAARDTQAKIVNLSQALVQKSLHKTHAISKDAKQAMIQIVKSGKIIVMAAGNEGITLGDDVYTQSLVDLTTSPEMEGRLILVGATAYPKLQERLEAHSDKAGQAKAHYFAAPGDDVCAADTMATGTSSATPSVAGGFALLMEAFPGLPLKDYIEIARESARKQSLNESTPFQSDIYGNGAFDVNATYELGFKKGLDIKSKAAAQNKPEEKVQKARPAAPKAAKPTFIEQAKTTAVAVGQKIVSAAKSVGSAVKNFFGW